MSEAGVPEGGAPAAPASSDPVTAGGLLREAREAAGLHPAALAVALKVPVGKLEALEQDRYDLLPDAVFTRGLASAICRNLKIDAQPVLDRLPRTTAPRLVRDNDGINAPFRSPRDGIAPNWREQLTRPVSLVVGALLVGVLVVLLLPRTGSDESASSAKPVEQAAESGAAGPDATTAPAPAQTGGPLMNASVSMPSREAPAPARTPPLPAEAPAAAAAPVLAPAASAAAAPATAADGTVVFRTTGEAWVEVRDAKGAVPIRKLMAAGESAAASGAMPLQVTVGKVDATQVQVRGQPFDLKPYARDNVARFEVK